MPLHLYTYKCDTCSRLLRRRKFSHKVVQCWLPDSTGPTASRNISPNPSVQLWHMFLIGSMVCSRHSISGGYHASFPSHDDRYVHLPRPHQCCIFKPVASLKASTSTMQKILEAKVSSWTGMHIPSDCSAIAPPPHLATPSEALSFPHLNLWVRVSSRMIVSFAIINICPEHPGAALP